MSTGYAFRIVNVFTVDGQPLSGNPLCVFEDARGLSDDAMQALARQMNLSETTFVLPPEHGGTAKVRIFTPGFEMPFAGHPTLGTASVVAGEGVEHVVLEVKAGDVPVVRDGASWTLRAAKAPVTRKVEASYSELTAMLSLPVDALAGEPLWVNTGVEQLIIPLSSVDFVRSATPVPDRLAKWGYSASRDEAMAYVFCDGVVRFFFTQHGAVIEDPATGSACANLGGYLLATGAALPIERSLRQGDAVLRPSLLHLRVDEDRSIYVRGEVIELGRGRISL